MRQKRFYPLFGVSCPCPKKALGRDARIVQNQDIPRLQIIGQVKEMPMPHFLRRSIQHKQA